MARMSFWERVEQCEHDWSEDYAVIGRCSTELCGGWHEYHCLKCGVYESSCGCGSNNGLNGWPYKRTRAMWRKCLKRAEEIGRQRRLKEQTA